MNRKGFTLIELLGTIVVLGIITSMVIIVIISVINSSKHKSYVITESNITKTALSYAKENNNSFFKNSITNKEYQCITIQELIDLGYFKTDIVESEVLNENTPIKVSPLMTIYVERDIDSKTFSEGHLIKDNLDVINSYCVSSITCPSISEYNGIYDGNEHTITLTNTDSLTLKYRIDSETSWTNTLPTRTNAGLTSVFIQVENSLGNSKYCGKSTINIFKKEIPKPECNEKIYNGKKQIVLSEHEEVLANINGYWNNSIEETNAGSYETMIYLNSNYKWSDNTENSYKKACKIDPKKLVITWENTSFYYDGRPHGPNASVNTEVINETMNLSTTKETTVGTHISTSACTSVTGGNSKCENYELDNKTIQYTINNHIKKTYFCKNPKWSNGSLSYVTTCNPISLNKSTAASGGYHYAWECTNTPSSNCGDGMYNCYQKTTFTNIGCNGGNNPIKYPNAWILNSTKTVTECTPQQTTWTYITCDE